LPDHPLGAEGLDNKAITATPVEAVMTRTRGEPPAGATRWSTRALANEIGMNLSASVRVWRALGLQP